MGVVIRDYPGLSVINMNAIEDNCCICDKYIVGVTKGIAMWEGLPVPPGWTGEWGGFSACDECYEKYQNGELEMWPVAANEQRQKGEGVAQK